jgi:predicted RNA-binding protein with PIN domain
MATPFLLIDGYNLLHAAGLARVKYGPGDLERARQRLLAMLTEKLTVAEQVRCTVVFDAQDAPVGMPRESQFRELRVVFAPPGGDADTVIEELVDHHPAAKQLLVVSGDHRLHKAARRRGATPIDSDPYWEQLRQQPDQRRGLTAPAAPPKPDAKTTIKPDTAAWLAEFGPISIEDLAAEVRAEDQAKPRDPWQQHLNELEQTLDDPRRRDAWLNAQHRKRG